MRVAALNASVPVIGFSSLPSNSREQLLHRQGFVVNKENYKEKEKYEVVRMETIFWAIPLTNEKFAIDVISCLRLRRSWNKTVEVLLMT